MEGGPRPLQLTVRRDALLEDAFRALAGMGSNFKTRLSVGGNAMPLLGRMQGKPGLACWHIHHSSAVPHLADLLCFGSTPVVVQQMYVMAAQRCLDRTFSALLTLVLLVKAAEWLCGTG